MCNKKPKYPDEYKEWVRRCLNVSISTDEENYYNSVTERIRNIFIESEFWKCLLTDLREFDAEYEIERKYKLFTSTQHPKIEIKPYKSLLQKTYRENVLENIKWPESPDGGWVLPKNWFERINDIIRTILIVKYLDGVEFIGEKIKSLCEEHNQLFKIFYEAKEEGYYAVHLYTEQEFEIPTKSWGTEKKRVSIELQITTQLQEVIRSLLHKYYEEKRISKRKEGVKWQWDYKGEEFITNYLGHILHYVEGMIMEIREKQEGVS